MENNHELAKTLSEHLRDDRKQFSAIHSTLANIKDNHLAHIQEATTSMAKDMKEMNVALQKNTQDTIEAKTNISWLMKIGGTVGVIILSALVGLWFKR